MLDCDFLDLLFAYLISLQNQELEYFWDDEQNYQLNEFRENFPDWDDD